MRESEQLVKEKCVLAATITTLINEFARKYPISAITIEIIDITTEDHTQKLLATKIVIKS